MDGLTLTPISLTDEQNATLEKLNRREFALYSTLAPDGVKGHILVAVVEDDELRAAGLLEAEA